MTTTGNRKYLDSWVAEVSVVHPNGDAIRRYLKLKSLQLKILNQKQVFLKHKHDTLDLDDSACSTAALVVAATAHLPTLPTPTMHRGAQEGGEEECCVAGQGGDAAAQDEIRYRWHGPFAAQPRLHRGWWRCNAWGCVDGTHTTPLTSWCLQAFVLFNEEESMFRCLADYHKFSGMYVLRHTCCVCVCMRVRACVCVRVRACACRRLCQ